MNATERFKILQNIVANVGIEADLWAELGKAEMMINMMDQQKMTPPPMPEMPAESMGQTEPMVGKYDNL